MNKQRNDRERNKGVDRRTIRIRSQCNTSKFLLYVDRIGKQKNRVINVNTASRIDSISHALNGMGVSNYIALPHYGYRADNLNISSLNVRDSSRLRVRSRLADCMRGDHVIMLQETRADVELYGYRNYYNPGNTGVVVLVKEDIFEQKRIEEEFEFGTIVEVKVNTLGGERKIAVGSIYIPHGSRKMEAREATLALYRRLCKNYFKVFQGGDYNTKYTEMERICQENNICINSQGNITRHDKRSSSCIDYILSNRVNVRYWVDTTWSDSDHQPVRLRARLLKPPGKSVRQVSSVIDYKSMINNISVLEKELEGKDDLGSITKACTDYSLGFTKPRELKYMHKHWLSCKTRNSIKRLKLKSTNFFEVLQASKDDETEEVDFEKEEVKLAAKEREEEMIVYQKLVKEDKLKAEERAHDRLVNSTSREMWKMLKRFSKGKRNSHVSLEKLQGDSVIKFETPSEVANEFLATFTVALGKEDNIESDSDFYMLAQTNKCDIDEPLLRNPFKRSEVTEAISRLARRKAAGLDGIPGELIKKSDVIAERLLKIFNDIWSTGKYPEEWNKSFIVPIYKKGDKKNSSNYRPITVMNALAKLYSILINNRLSKIIRKYDIIKEEQGGFMPRKNCIQQVSVLHELCARRKRLGQDTALLFVDFAKAYDSVNHRILFKKLNHYGIRGNLLANIMSMYANTSVCVRVSNVDSVEQKVLCGLKQGDPTSPMLFNLYINDLVNEFHTIECPAVVDPKAYTRCQCNAPVTKSYHFGTLVNRACSCPLREKIPTPQRSASCNPSIPIHEHEISLCTNIDGEPTFADLVACANFKPAEEKAPKTVKSVSTRSRCLYSRSVPASVHAARHVRCLASRGEIASDSDSDSMDALLDGFSTTSTSSSIYVPIATEAIRAVPHRPRRGAVSAVTPSPSTGKKVSYALADSALDVPQHRYHDTCVCWEKDRVLPPPPKSKLDHFRAQVGEECGHNIFNDKGKTTSFTHYRTQYSEMQQLEIGCLLYADDLVIVSEPSDIQDNAARLEDWCARNCMTINVSKCGYMAVIGEWASKSRKLGKDTKRTSWTEEQKALHTEEKIPQSVSFALGTNETQILPLSTSYTYLGVDFQADLSVVPALRARCSKALTAINMYTHYISQRSCGIFAKNHLLRGVVLPTLLYGVEYWCTAPTTQMRKVYTTFNTCVRKAYRMCSSTSADLQCHLVGIKPLEVFINKRVIRAYTKNRRYGGLFKKLAVTHPLRRFKRGQTYIDKQHIFMNQFYDDNLKGCSVDWDVQGNNIFHINRYKVVIEVMKNQSLPKALTAEDKDNQLPHRLHIFSMDHSRYFKSMRALIMVLLGKFPGCQRLAKWGYIDNKYDNKCPMCEEPVGEDLQHYLFDCSTFAADRKHDVATTTDIYDLVDDQVSPVESLGSMLGCTTVHSLTRSFDRAKESQYARDAVTARNGHSSERLQALCIFIEATNSRRQAVISKLQIEWKEQKDSTANIVTDMVDGAIPSDLDLQQVQ